MIYVGFIKANRRWRKVTEAATWGEAWNRLLRHHGDKLVKAAETESPAVNVVTQKELWRQG